MGYALVIVGYVIYVILGISCLICIASIISHIVRRHILWDRQQDLVSKINWNIQQKENSAETEAMKFEEQNVFKSMSHHKHMIVMIVVNIFVLMVIAVIVAIIIGTGIVG
ncbi:MAG: hypothetical protein IKE09_05960 [Clostridiales bacterium]|nr:hypothetical protein [Clostridiales bacterium]